MKEKPPFGILMTMTLLGALSLILVPVAFLLWVAGGPVSVYWMLARTLAYPLVCGILWWQSWARFRAGRVGWAFALAAPPALVSAVGIGLYVYSTATAFQKLPTRSRVAESVAPSPAPTAALSPGAALRYGARALFDAAHPEQALEKYREAIRLQPEASDYVGVARCLDKLGKRKEARDAYQKALELAPGNAEIEYALAQSLLQGGRPSEAIEHFRKITTLEPNNAGAFINVGVALLGTGRKEEALKQFREAARLPTNGLEPTGLAYYDVGATLARLNRPKEALEAYRKAVDLSPDDADAQDALANAFLMESRFDEAVTHFKKVAALEPGKPRGFTGIGMASYGAGRCAEAMAPFAKSLQLCKKCLEANEVATYEICREKAAH